MSLRITVVSYLILVAQLALHAHAQKVELQPFRAQIERIEKSLRSVGQPLPADVAARLTKAKQADNAIVAIQEVLDPLCIAMVDINAESRVKVAAGPAQKQLVQQGWTSFLVKGTKPRRSHGETPRQQPQLVAPGFTIHGGSQGTQQDQSTGSRRPLAGNGNS